MSLPGAAARGGLRPLLALVLMLVPARQAGAMQIERDGDQLVLSGPVVAGDLDRIKGALDAAPAVRTVILRNSLGGDAPTGYRVGELIRARGLRTAVSGFCISSCSRMFLGGVERAFTDDLPPTRTFVGFHGHYDGQGNLNAASVRALGLEAWILRFTDGKADPALVHRWVNIGRGGGTASFYPVTAVAAGHPAATICEAPAGSSGPFTCEKLPTTALRMGVTTTDALAHSHTSPPSPTMPPASGWAAIADLDRLPSQSPRARSAYAGFLAWLGPRAFALSPDKQHFGWSISFADPASRALAACTTAAAQACRLYAVDDAVVWTGP